MSCQFQLNRYEVESVAVTPHDGHNPKLKSHTGDVTSKIQVAQHNKDPRKYLLVLEILVHPTKGREAKFYPYNIAIKGRGHFFFKEEAGDDVHRALNVNGAAILYGLLRAQVAQITAQAVRGQFLLPPLNFVEMYEDKKENGRASKPLSSCRNNVKR